MTDARDAAEKRARETARELWKWAWARTKNLYSGWFGGITTHDCPEDGSAEYHFYEALVSWGEEQRKAGVDEERRYNDAHVHAMQESCKGYRADLGAQSLALAHLTEELAAARAALTREEQRLWEGRETLHEMRCLLMEGGWDATAPEILLHCGRCGEGFGLSSLLGKHCDEKHAGVIYSKPGAAVSAHKDHGPHRIKCLCEGCQTMIPACWLSGMCKPCITEDCEHEEAAVPASEDVGVLERWRNRAFALCERRGWDMKPTPRLGFHVQEAAELCEAVRGKGGDVIEEAGDSLFTALAMIPKAVPLSEVLRVNNEKVARLMEAPPYAGEERAAVPAEEPRVFTNYTYCTKCGALVHRGPCAPKPEPAPEPALIEHEFKPADDRWAKTCPRPDTCHVLVPDLDGTEWCHETRERHKAPSAAKEGR